EVFSGGGTARAIATSTLSGTGTPGAPAASSVALLELHNPLQEIFVSLPILLGGGLGGTQSTGLSVAAYLHGASLHPIVYAGNLILVTGAVGLIVCVAVRVLRQWRGLHVTDNHQPPTRGQLLTQFEAALLLICAFYAVAVLLYRDMNFASPRYLLPFFAATPLVIRQADLVLGRAWGAGSAARLRTGATWDLSRVRMLVPNLLVVGVFVPVMIWNLAGDLALRPIQTAALDQTVWVYGNDQPVLTVLRAHHAHTFITDDYWIGMRLAFESGESVIPVIADPAGNLGLNRYPPYVMQGLADQHPAYIELVATPAADELLRQWQAGHYPGYAMARIGLYLVFTPG
ncbi:MAG TPA: hypothetical protein VGN32_19725, partial [Ktedonobacterales bacterium]|nr:hypothetical protein [Ktedonobacterales bacterium]